MLTNLEILALASAVVDAKRRVADAEAQYATRMEAVQVKYQEQADLLADVNAARGALADAREALEKGLAP